MTVEVGIGIPPDNFSFFFFGLFMAVIYWENEAFVLPCFDCCAVYPHGTLRKRLSNIEGSTPKKRLEIVVNIISIEDDWPIPHAVTRRRSSIIASLNYVLMAYFFQVFSMSNLRDVSDRLISGFFYTAPHSPMCARQQNVVS